MPAPIAYARDLLPSTYGVEAFARSFDAHPDWSLVGDLAVCAAVGVVSLAVATWAYRRAVPPRATRSGEATHRHAWHDVRVTAPLTPPAAPGQRPVADEHRGIAPRAPSRRRPR